MSVIHEPCPTNGQKEISIASFVCVWRVTTTNTGSKCTITNTFDDDIMKVQSVYRVVCVHLYLSEITLLKESAYTRTATLLLRAINTLPVESETFMGVYM